MKHKVSKINPEDKGVNELYEEIIVANPKDLKKQMKLRFLVDTGCSGSAIPLRVAKALNLECVGEGEAILANGKTVKIKVAYVYMKIDDEHVFTLIGYDGCEEPLLGFEIMNILGLQVDTAKKQLLKPMKRFTLKKLHLRSPWITLSHKKDEKCESG